MASRPDPRSLRQAGRTAGLVGLGAGLVVARTAARAGRAAGRAWDDPDLRRLMVTAGVEGALIAAPRLLPLGPVTGPMVRRVGLGLAAIAVARADRARREADTEGDGDPAPAP
ncbi:MAG: hypothetical protein MUE51_15495 [Thermoleophilia bacterium]|jgi:ABC-type taurine transport system ATPase subunit|nr:hypothetical protein [Thermoleophilia bacterium]